jgi:16S rRNA (cytidine1402-2'-O)-methyltransferase
VTVCRELTKQFETIETMPAGQLPGWLAADANRARGEFVLVLHALAAADVPGEGAHDALLAPLLAALPLRQAVALAADIGGAPRNLLYARALELRAQADDADRDPDRD